MRRRWPWIVAAASVVLLLLAAGALLTVRQRLVYGARAYPADAADHLPPGVEQSIFSTAEGRQVAFYRPPASGQAAERIWLVCYGNSNLALDWVPLVAKVDDPDAGWLILEYPGFGFCAGRSSPDSILASAAAAVETLRLRLNLAPEAMSERIGVLGYSLGCATGLQYAARHPVRRIVLIAPYTSLAEIGDRVCWPCGSLLPRFDNTARLAEIALQQTRPSVLILHGGRDECIPPEMSARLQAAHAEWIVREVVPDADHGSIVARSLPRLVASDTVHGHHIDTASQPAARASSGHGDSAAAR